MTNTPLNPEALEASIEAVESLSDGCGSYGTSYEIAKKAVSAYLAVAQPVVNSDKASAWDEGFQAGWEENESPSPFVNYYWDSKTPNPYEQKENN